MVEAAALLAGRPGIKFVMAGDGPSKQSLISLADSRGVTNLRFEDTVPRPLVASILASCDAAVVPLAAELPGTMPSKVYEAIASGVPLVVTRGCEAESLVNEHGVGRVFAPLDAEDLSSIIADMAECSEGLKDMSERCRKLSEQFDLDRIACHAEAVLIAVSEGRPLPDLRR